MATLTITTPTRAMVALAGFVRDRLGEVSGTVAAAFAEPEVEPRGGELVAAQPPQTAGITEVTVTGLARQFAVAVVGAAAPFAPTSYARARLLRQLHASGLLTDDEVRRTARLIDAGALPPALLEDTDVTVIDADSPA